MAATVFALPGNEVLASALARLLDAEEGHMEHRHFPDGETYLRFVTPVAGKSVALCCSLHAPNEKTLPLLLAAAALRELGATRVGLVAPYLAYMRQDKRFREGEAVTSATFARLLSAGFDWIATIDPHLHRYSAMSDIYTVPVAVGHAAPILAAHLRQHAAGLFLVGPDEESEQWVSAIGAAAGVPHVTMRKTRHGDREVSIDMPGLAAFRGRRPVLADDMISTGHTMEVAVRQLVAQGFPAPLCLAVHGILAEHALERLRQAGAEVLTTNTIPGPAAQLDVTPLLGELVSPYLASAQ